MRIEPSPSPLVPPEIASQNPLGQNPLGDALAGTPFATLLGDEAAPEPPERALTFVELGMFGAYAGVSPVRLALGIEEQAQPQESAAPPEPSPAPAAPAAAGTPAPGVVTAPASEKGVAAPAPEKAVAAANVDLRSATEQPFKNVVTEALAAKPWSIGSLPSGAFTETPAVVDEAAPVAASLSRTMSTPAPAPAEVRPRTAAQPSFEDVGLGAAPEKGRVPKQATGRAPLAAVLVEEGGNAKLAVAAAALAPGGAARLRAVAARLLAEHGIELGEMWINGGSEPASAAQGEGHGSRTR